MPASGRFFPRTNRRSTSSWLPVPCRPENAKVRGVAAVVPRRCSQRSQNAMTTDVIALTRRTVDHSSRHDVRMGCGEGDGCWCTTGGARSQSAQKVCTLLKHGKYQKLQISTREFSPRHGENPKKACRITG